MQVTSIHAEALARLAADAGPAVVGLGRGWSGGSGVVLARDTVLTLAHNLRGEEATVLLGGERRAARVAGVDADADLAVLTVPTGDVVPVAFADEAPSIGTPIVALADPGGRGLRVTPGFVAAAPRRVRGARGRRIDGAIEHTAPLPRGSSGGPLLDLEGRLLGLSAVRLEGGLILAVPAVRARVEALARGEVTARPRLGVAVAPPRVARRMRRAVGLSEREGLLVRAVEEDSPAAASGLARGDLIVAAGGRPADSVDALHAGLDGLEPGARLRLVAVRGEDEREVEVEVEVALGR
jgi:S1-C subfamily serine protease